MNTKRISFSRLQVTLITILLGTVVVLGWVFFRQSQETPSQTSEATASSLGKPVTEDGVDYLSYQIDYRPSNYITLPNQLPKRLTFNSSITIPYPSDGVKGIYVTANSANSSYFNQLIDLLDKTALNSMVIDIKEDLGNITLDFQSQNELIKANTDVTITDKDAMMKSLEKHQIYPIARIVVFKDSNLAMKHPEMSFVNPNGSVWLDNNGHAFVNPFLKEVWDYNIEVAKEAARLGFKEIQFDYVRFAEGFELIEDRLTYNQGDYANLDMDLGQKRVKAITDFLAYAKEQLKFYNVEVSVDIFGYTATLEEATGIGQNFLKMSQHVDVVSSMIYPSHWGEAYFGIVSPDLHPYDLIAAYIQEENKLLATLEKAPTTRPWLQNFTASYLPDGTYQVYGPFQVSQQIKALKDNGVNEYLLWDAGNEYFENADY